MPKLRDLKLKRLKATVKYAFENVPLYKKKFEDAGINLDEIRNHGDVARLPFTEKEELRGSYPFGMVAVPFDEIVRVHATSGTTGKPTVACYTKNDIETWTDLMARCMYTAGVRHSDIVQNAYGYGLFTGALGFHYGGERIGATIIPTGSGNTQRQLMIINDFGTTVLCSTPSFAAYLAEVAKEQHMNMSEDMKIRLGLFGAEAWSDELRKRIEQEYNMLAIDFYGLAEIIGPGVSVECGEKND